MELFITEKLEDGSIKIIKQIEEDSIEELKLLQLENNNYQIMTRDLLDKYSSIIN